MCVWVGVGGWVRDGMHCGMQISSTNRTCGADLINSQHIHVLVDICGLHANGTMLYRSILARRPAGVQVAYMAFAGLCVC